MRELVNIDRRILSRIAHEDTLQADIIRDLLTETGEAYAYARIRTLQARGLIRKTGPANQRIITLTPAGREVLSEVLT
jgi:DNA-binding PadR family transcriptional regulator